MMMMVTNCANRDIEEIMKFFTLYDWEIYLFICVCREQKKSGWKCSLIRCFIQKQSSEVSTTTTTEEQKVLK